MDFGLAKAMDPVAQGFPPSPGFGVAGSPEAVTNSPTLSMMATQAGVILGTAAYMSPEQAKGSPADQRSDVFSFGTMLYEMLTGRQPFKGETAPDILASVLIRDPDLSALPPNLNPRITDLLRRCLEKNPKRRWQAVGDLRAELEIVAAAPYRTPEAATFVAQSRHERLAWLIAAVATTALLVLAAPAIRHLRETPRPDAPEMRTEIVTPATNDPLSFALSPDGRQLVFVASGDGPSRLWLRPLAATAAQPLAGTEGAAFPFWSPDSRSVGFFADGKLKRLDLGGGQPQVLTDAFSRGGTWNADGVILFARTAGGPLFRVSASGGEAVAVTKLDRQSSHRFPSFLPDGRHFLFYAQGTPDTGGIYLGSLDSRQTRRG